MRAPCARRSRIGFRARGTGACHGLRGRDRGCRSVLAWVSFDGVGAGSILVGGSALAGGSALVGGSALAGGSTLGGGEASAGAGWRAGFTGGAVVSTGVAPSRTR